MDREAKRLELQARLDGRKTQAERNRLGQFATPTKLAIDIVASALQMLPQRTNVRFLDPAFGTGAFYSALLECGENRIESASAFEIDPHYGDGAKEFWKGHGLVLQLADFTQATPDAGHNFVICNPPYVRHHHLGQDIKNRLRESVSAQVGIELNGLSGLYCYFMVLSTAWMADKGVAAWLIPSEFMDVNYGQKVKHFLLSRVTLERIHRFDPNDGQFDDALVSSAVVFFRNEKPTPGHKATFSYGGSLTNPATASEFNAETLRSVVKWTSLPSKSPAERKKSGVRLNDLFKIKRGLATGCNSFFVMTAEKAKQHRIPEEFLTPILPSPRYLENDVIEADRNGNPLLGKSLFLLSCTLPESEVQERHPYLWKYLQSGIEAGINQRYLCKHREPWYSQENRPAAPFVLTYMGRTGVKSEAPFRFILNRSRATAANVYLMLYPKPPLAKAIDSNPDCIQAIWQGLNAITGEMFTDEGRVYGGGLHKIEPKELANVPAKFVLDAIGEGLEAVSQRNLFAV